MLDLKFARIQFTPDLMPSDITGTDLIQEDPATGRRQMVFAPGPIFANIVLADEINRTPPKTQSALLEAMQEHRVTIQGRTYELEEPFYVFATQNPIELEGTYPLPEAQLDRFMFHIVIDHPPEDEEFEVVRSTTSIRDVTFERPVSGADLIAFQRLVRRVPVAEPVIRYALDLVRASRPKSPGAPEAVKKWVAFGASVRAAQYLVLGAKARALTARPLPRQLRGHPRAGAPGAPPPRADELPRAVGRRDERRARRQAAGGRRGAAVGNVGRMPNMSNEHPAGSLVGARFVDPVVLARIGNLELVARTVVDGFINGLHRSPYFGASVDFAEHRGYTPGDDIRRVDWRVFARTDRFYVKEYEADTNANFAVLLDVSRSMGFGSRGITKLDYGRLLAACLTYLVHRQRDRVGFVTFDDDIVEYVPPSAKHMDVVLHVLDRLSPTRPGRLGPPMRKLAEHFSRRGHPRAHLGFLRGAGGRPRGARPAAVPGARPHRLPRARSGGDRLRVRRRVERSKTSRAASRCRSCRRRWPSSTAQLIRAHIEALATKCSELRIDYALLNTAAPLDHALFDYLSARERLTRVR